MNDVFVVYDDCGVESDFSIFFEDVESFGDCMFCIIDYWVCDFLRKCFVIGELGFMVEE